MDEQFWTDKVAGIYRNLEEELIEIVVRQLKKGTNNKKELAQWQLEKMQDLGMINLKTIQKVMKASQLAEEVVEEAFEIGPKTVLQQVDRASQQKYKEPTTNTGQIIKGYMKQAKDQMNMLNEGMGLWNYGSEDMIQKYRGILERTATFVNTGMFTLEEGVQRASQEILTTGLKTQFVDKAGRQIPVDSYIRSVMKTNLARTYDEVRKEHMEQYDMHLVVVGSLAGARDACELIQGRVVDLRPLEEVPFDAKYKSIYDPIWQADYKQAHGHHGINCRHPHFPFVDGVNTNNQPEFDHETNERVREDQQKQRSLERQIRRYKKNLKIAQEFGNQKDIDRYSKLIRGRQEAIRTLVDGNEYLSRDYNRERAFDFRTTPLKMEAPPAIKDKSTPKPEPIEVPKSVVEYFDSKDHIKSLEYFETQPEYIKWRKGLTELERSSLHDYSEEFYEYTNAYLRDGKSYLEMTIEEFGDDFLAEEIKAVTNLIDQGISKYTTPEPIKLYRNNSESLMPEKLMKTLVGSKPGDRIVPDKSFQSTAVSKSAAEKFGGEIMYDIEVPEGLNVGAYIREEAAFHVEDEFLLRPNIEFEILENQIEDEGVIKMRVLGSKSDFDI